MAATPTRRIAEPQAAPAVLAVAASGGRDSTALLHCTARLAAAQGLAVVALHVHHGLHPDADAWVAHLQRQVRRWARGGLPVTLRVQRLDSSPAPGQSIEAWARRERYRALAAMAQDAGCDTVLLAHHRRDQAETLLLQALRGGGPAALAAMPRSAQRQGLRWLRPWLEQPREAIEAYVRRHRLGTIDDASNADPRFVRNRLRLQVWPALVAAFPDAEAALAAAARRAQESDAALRELVALDLSGCLDADGALTVAAWLRLSPARRGLALRGWLGPQLSGGLPETLVQRLLTELPRPRAARWPAAGGELRCHDGRVVLARPVLAAVPAASTQPEVATPRLDLSRPGRHPVPEWQGSFVVDVADHGLAPAQLREVELRARSGGERWQLAPRGMARTLKKQYQARRVAAWDRVGPLLYAGDELLFVPGLGMAAAQCASGPAPRLQLRWEPDQPQ